MPSIARKTTDGLLVGSRTVGPGDVEVQLDHHQGALYQKWKVELIRTDGTGDHKDDARLQLVKAAIVKYSLISVFRIVALLDHKGDLCVRWAGNEMPPPAERRVIDWIWESFAYEQAETVSHVLD